MENLLSTRLVVPFSAGKQEICGKMAHKSKFPNLIPFKRAVFTSCFCSENAEMSNPTSKEH